jgi:hypothetical protein
LLDNSGTPSSIRWDSLASPPEATEPSFDDWWERVGASVSGEECKGINSLIILGAWCIWKHRNSCVFDGVSPSTAAVLNLAREEAHLWSLAGAKTLAFLSIRVGVCVRLYLWSLSVWLLFPSYTMIHSSPAYSRKKKCFILICTH